MEPPPVTETLKISYQMPRNVLIRMLSRRRILRPHIIGSMTIGLALAALCFVVRAGAQSAGFVILIFVVMTPTNIHRAVVRAVDRNSQLTDPKTLEVSSTRLA